MARSWQWLVPPLRRRLPCLPATAATGSASSWPARSPLLIAQVSCRGLQLHVCRLRLPHSSGHLPLPAPACVGCELLSFVHSVRTAVELSGLQTYVLGEHAPLHLHVCTGVSPHTDPYTKLTQLFSLQGLKSHSSECLCRALAQIRSCLPRQRTLSLHT